MKSRQEIERLARQKAKNRLTLILLCILIVSVTAIVLLLTLLPEEAPPVVVKDPPEIIEGVEGIYNSYAVAYPHIEESQIQAISVTNKSSYEDSDEPTTYKLMRDKNNGGKFALAYEDINGVLQLYSPDIVYEDSSFDYESLYSIEQNDGYNRIYKLTYLCVALELAYFDERIVLDEDPDEKAFQLRQFGLDEPSASITFVYLDADKKSQTRTIKIGDKNPTGLGYYFMVDDRPYVYSSTANYYDYALLGFYSYVNSVLVSKGLPEDSSFEPYLTTDFKQWVNQTYKEAGTEIEKDSTVIAYTDIFSPLESGLDTKVSDENKDGYIKEGYSLIEVDLKKKGNYLRLVNALVGKKLGIYFDSEKGIGTPEDQIIVTLSTDAKTIDFANAALKKYQYEIIEIEAIVTDAADVTAAGTAVGTNNLLRIAYYLTVDGKKISDIPYHGVIDLSSGKFDTDAIARIRELSVGKLDTEDRVTLSVDYTKDNAVPVDIAYKIVEIIAIYDKDGIKTDKITEDSQVVYRYCFVRNGNELSYDTAAIDLGKDDTETGAKIKAQLIGKTTSKNLDIIGYEYTGYCEFLQDFLVYKIARTDYFVTSKLVSAFRFQNNSQRDPYYGESLYENRMDNEYKMYGLNSAACEEVVKVLGGVGETTGQTDGLVGSETVAVGLTPEIKEYYGLYAHTIYFELPRGIIVIDSGDEETIDDYTWYETLGFTLYISDVQPDGTRYVGSDLYDIVAKVSADKLVFLERSFVDFWARRNLMLVDVEYIRNFKVEFMMDDLAGSYTFSLSHRDLYLYTDVNGNQQGSFTEQPSYSDIYNFITVNTSYKCNCSGECKCIDTKFKEMYEEYGMSQITLAALYDKYTGEGEGIAYNGQGQAFIGNDTAGTAYFKEILEMLFYTQYSGSLTEAEQAEALKSAPMVMRFSVKLRDSEDAPNASPYNYVYEFYRCDDRRVMVRLYQATSSGMKVTDDVTDFYVSTLAFKKIVVNIVALLNAEQFDTEMAYPNVSDKK